MVSPRCLPVMYRLLLLAGYGLLRHALFHALTVLYKECSLRCGQFCSQMLQQLNAERGGSGAALADVLLQGSSGSSSHKCRAALCRFQDLSRISHSQVSEQ